MCCVKGLLPKVESAGYTGQGLFVAILAELAASFGSGFCETEFAEASHVGVHAVDLEAELGSIKLE